MKEHSPVPSQYKARSHRSMFVAFRFLWQLSAIGSLGWLAWYCQDELMEVGNLNACTTPTLLKSKADKRTPFCRQESANCGFSEDFLFFFPKDICWNANKTEHFSLSIQSHIEVVARKHANTQQNAIEVGPKAG